MSYVASRLPSAFVIYIFFMQSAPAAIAAQAYHPYTIQNSLTINKIEGWNANVQGSLIQSKDATTVYFATRKQVYPGEPIVVSQGRQDLLNKLFSAEVYVMRSAVLEWKNRGYLPPDFQVVFPKCGEANAFYDPQNKAVVMCQELLYEFARFSAEFSPNKKEWFHSAFGMILFVFIHEMGHAMIDLHDLPILGAEEDAVDRLAIIFAASIRPELNNDLGEHMILGSAMWFKRMGSETSAKAYWDEHPLNEQRYFTIICLLYGSNPSKYASVAQFAGLPPARARRCPSEFSQALKGWNKILGGL